MDAESSTSDSPPNGDSVIPASTEVSTYIRPQARKLHDSAITFEEHHYYANRTRAEEDSTAAPKTNWREVVLRKKPAQSAGQTVTTEKPASTINTSNRENRIEISDQEWTDASRAFRTAAKCVRYATAASSPT